MKNKILLLGVLFAVAICSYSQNYIKIVNQDILKVDEIIVDTATITYKFAGVTIKTTPGITFINQNGNVPQGYETTVNRQDVEYIETEDGTLVYAKEPTSNGLNIEVSKKDWLKDLIKKGNNVYIPMPTEQTDVTNRLGNALLRDYVKKAGYWNVVEKESEAHFILEYVFSERGHDNGKLVVKNRFGKRLAHSAPESARDNNPRIAGEKSAKALLENWTKSKKVLFLTLK
jgi:hypothetical protein